MSDITMYSVNPLDVEERLKQAGWKYRNSGSREEDYVYANVGVIPALFRFVSMSSRVPTCDECARHIWPLRTARQNDEELARARTRKLVMDFMRDLHTYGLLTKHAAFGMVRYQKGMDLGYNVDFTSSLALHLGYEEDDIGIQCSMKASWSEVDFVALKERRRARRQAREWTGPHFLLTNKDRPQVLRAGGCWLFTPAHIDDLVEEISGKKVTGEVAIVQQLSFLR